MKCIQQGIIKLCQDPQSVYIHTQASARVGDGQELNYQHALISAFQMLLLLSCSLASLCVYKRYNTKGSTATKGFSQHMVYNRSKEIIYLVKRLHFVKVKATKVLSLRGKIVGKV